MSAVLSRRAALSGAVASVAMVGVAVAGAAAVAPTAPAGVSTELLRLIADAKRASAASLAYDRDVLSPAYERRTEAVEAAQASLVHVTADAGESSIGGRIVWTTVDPVHVAMAKSAVRLAREGKLNLDDGGEYVRAARKITAATLRNDRAIARVRQAHDTTALDNRSFDACNASADADELVVDFTPRSLADVRAKLAFMVENDLGNGIDRLSMMVADIDALSAREG